MPDFLLADILYGVWRRQKRFESPIYKKESNDYIIKINHSLKTKVPPISFFFSSSPSFCISATARSSSSCLQKNNYLWRKLPLKGFSIQLFCKISQNSLENTCNKFLQGNTCLYFATLTKMITIIGVFEAHLLNFQNISLQKTSK